ncbi:MAG: UDP-N-acetyl glucosamine 2-epimerase [Candidatus Altiarchaeota archaeon]|nr:UDP-N-acetyl glucosamine 2-epimerase [Candidatus Altiarchaeota archaeon]
MAKVAFSIGTNAELIKIFPVLKRLDEYTLIHTGQHSIGKLLDLFDLPEPELTLSAPPKATTKFFFNTPKAAIWSLGMIGRIRRAIKKSKAEVIAYHGDTMSTASSALATRLSSAKGAHLEAGLRSGSIWEPWPEEISRKIADKYSKLLMAVSQGTQENLINARVRGRIVNTGNTIIDAALEAHQIGKGVVDTPDTEYAIVTAHRQENLRSEKRMRNLVEIVKNIPIPTYFFVHDNTVAALKKFNLYKPLANKVKLARFTNYPSFIQWLANSRILFTDGGSIQEESLVFKKPCILLRKKTERVEGLKTGINFLTDMNVQFAIRKMDEVLSDDWKTPKFKNPYGEKGVSKKVVKELKSA